MQPTRQTTLKSHLQCLVIGTSSVGHEIRLEKVWIGTTHFRGLHQTPSGRTYIRNRDSLLFSETLLNRKVPLQGVGKNQRGIECVKDLSWRVQGRWRNHRWGGHARTQRKTAPCKEIIRAVRIRPTCHPITDLLGGKVIEHPEPAANHVSQTRMTREFIGEA